MELWHRDPANIGSSLSKYTVVNLVHTVTEHILSERPGSVGKGFRKAGIVPWNPKAPSIERMSPSLAYAKDEDQELPGAQDEETGVYISQQDASECRVTSSTTLLQPADSRFHARFKHFLSQEKLQFCREKWLSGEKLDHPVYRAWELLKLSSISDEEQQGRRERQVLEEQRVLKELRVRVCQA